MFDAAPEKTTEFRLATLDNLLMQGRITPAKHAEARTEVLGEI